MFVVPKKCRRSERCNENGSIVGVAGVSTSNSNAINACNTNRRYWIWISIFAGENKKSNSVANAMGTRTYRCQFTIDWLLVLHDALGNIPLHRKCPESIVDMRPSTQHNKCQCFPSYSLPRAWPFSLSLRFFSTYASLTDAQIERYAFTR